MVKRITATVLLIIAVTFFAPRAFALIQQTGPNSVTIQGKDIVGSTLPLIVEQKAQFPENTWGRVIRLVDSKGQFFDLGIDEQGNFFINTPKDTKTSHSLTISPSGLVTF
ncbi:hypothetical protein LC608_28745 [Nostoc sp. XA010]|uniref:hypothetical protein n=1 Tax=Nostoc sp. XA010 TaxID=2780407 RepID=UPI001E5A161E|nr:hypothetical protein [Nostoc sp. XA010]MCC5660890.1 hypothetical protein [Nostoc sp. XA010]